MGELMSKKVAGDYKEEEWFINEEDDADTAFWDEFFSLNEDKLDDSPGKKYSLKVTDEETGEEWVFEGIRVRKKTVVIA